ncbi:unnamed protein product [Ostreobium quekettii]|uniref:MORN repeat-containing protein 3 n=1 Tax=Ostreobium quekettii TaxID=121088 RepID=A0A8S1IJS0_9CHLO|nr:unnamed protein product [Ostreobium quekettii]
MLDDMLVAFCWFECRQMRRSTAYATWRGHACSCANKFLLHCVKMPPHVEGTLTADSLRKTQQLWKTWERAAEKEGSRHTVYWVNGAQYVGEWGGNKRDGKGTHFYRNGDKYEGDWKNGMREGLGTLWIFHDGKYRLRYNGSWEANVPMRGLF